MPRWMLVAVALVVAAGSAVVPAVAQPQPGFRGPVFRIEPETRSDHARPGFVTGWLYNDGQGVAGLVRMKVEMLDPSGTVIAEHVGWAYGNVSPGNRTFFMITVPPRSPQERRITVESYVLQSFQGP